MRWPALYCFGSFCASLRLAPGTAGGGGPRLCRSPVIGRVKAVNSQAVPGRRSGSPGRPVVHRQTLIQMNLAAFTARRDAAHERTAEVLTSMTPAMSRPERVRQYRFALHLVDEAILASRRSQERHDTPLTQYFRFLRDTVAAALAMVNYEIMVTRESEAFSRLAGPEFVQELTAAGDVFSAGEQNVRDNIRDLLRLGEKIRSEDTEKRKALFGEGDAERYQTTLEEYRRYYRAAAPAAAEEPHDDPG